MTNRVYPYACQERAAWPEGRHSQLPQEIERRNIDFKPSCAPNATLAMDLLLANKTIYEEASQVLFTENTFVMPTWTFMSRFFTMFAGRPQLNWIRKIELFFTPLDPFAAPGNLGIESQRSTHERQILLADFPGTFFHEQRSLIPRFLIASPILRSRWLHDMQAERKDLITAWLRKARLAQSLAFCQKITLRLDEAADEYGRMHEYPIWPFVMPSIITVRLGWTPSLPDGVQVEGLPANVTLESIMSNIQTYRIRDISLYSVRPGNGLMWLLG